MSKEKAEELGVTPKMKIEGYAIAGFDAELMGYSPKFSSEKLANKLGVDLKSIDMFEINEAFASQAYAVSRDLGLDPEKVNIIWWWNFHWTSDWSNRSYAYCKSNV